MAAQLRSQRRKSQEREREMAMAEVDHLAAERATAVTMAGRETIKKQAVNSGAKDIRKILTM